MSLSPPCFTEEDRFSLEALQTIHKQMDDDKDGGIDHCALGLLVGTGFGYGDNEHARH